MLVAHRTRQRNSPFNPSDFARPARWPKSHSLVAAGSRPLWSGTGGSASRRRQTGRFSRPRPRPGPSAARPPPYPPHEAVRGTATVPLQAGPPPARRRRLRPRCPRQADSPLLRSRLPSLPASPRGCYVGYWDPAAAATAARLGLEQQHSASAQPGAAARKWGSGTHGQGGVSVQARLTPDRPASTGGTDLRGGKLSERRPP